MNYLHLFAIAAAVLLGGIVGLLLTQLHHFRRHPRRKPKTSYTFPRKASVGPDALRRVHDVSSAWVTSHGRPRAFFLALGYLTDATEDAFRRSWCDPVNTFLQVVSVVAIWWLLFYAGPAQKPMRETR